MHKNKSSDQLNHDHGTINRDFFSDVASLCKNWKCNNVYVIFVNKMNPS